MIELKPKRYDLGLYDAKTGADLKTLRAVDVSEECPVREWPEDKAIFLFGKAVRGRLCKMTLGGASIHFFVDELEKEMNAAPRDDTFGQWAKWLGHKKANLKIMIQRLAP